MKITELCRVKKNRIGHINKNNVRLELNEEKTLNHLILFGFNIDLIRPVNTKMAKNPDVLIMGTIWEIKTPISSNRNTIKNRFREASSQATNIIFDTRFIKKDADKAEKQIIKLFKGDGRVRRMMIVKQDGRLVDILK